MDWNDGESGFAAGFPPALVSLTPFPSTASPTPRRLSSCFTLPAAPVRSKRRLAWVSLQGRLVGAEEASSAKTVDPNGAFTAKEAAAWELFTPAQRFLTVAVVGAAASDSKKNEQIFNLKKSVQLRDQVLYSMQKKLDNLCEQLSYFKDQPEVEATTTMECGCKLKHHSLTPHDSLFNTSAKGSNGDEEFKYKLPISNQAELDERRMSDLSDWAPSVTSSVDIELDSLSLEDGIDDLKKECEEKDATIKELSTYLRSSEVLSSKRIMELEDIIRCKNMIINKLRKDIVTLEQKVVGLTRRRRQSFPADHVQHLPTLTDNVVYDMDSTTDPSSSDSDSIPRNRALVERQQISEQKGSKGDVKCDLAKSSPLVQQGVRKNTFSPNTTTTEIRSRRRPPIKSKEVGAQKRWM
ncbi:hypothetical protein SASPL_135350 [Salvia splendens]|uniref:Uncharacterized protein n=1 Tax=Salvia splendens TaxID=180675 RepID=A0A8X8WXS6_SALSN|nr:uncharacterized protein LOC121761040 [Salvia splendens]KAG6403133.1 hypothetical protein SASPL_135350 [Salvia splendens]